MSAALATRQIIYQSEHLTVVYAEQGSKTVFATFNDMWMTARGTEYAESDALEAIGVTTIGFVSARPNWYPKQDMLAAIQIARGCIAGRRVVTFGVAQGGYGAIKFASRLSANLALGFSPQWSIDPAHVANFDIRFFDYYHAALRNGERIERTDIGGQNIIFVDPRENADAAHAERLLQLGNINLVPMPFSGHQSFRLLGQSGHAQRFFRLCSSDVTRAQLRQLIREVRPDSIEYVTGVVAKFGEVLPRHQHYFRAAVARMPPGPDQILANIQLHLARRDFAKAKLELTALSDEQLLTVDLGRAWGIFRRASFHDGERRIAPLFKRRYPTDTYMRQIGVDSMIVAGYVDEAIKELLELQSIPGSIAHLDRFASLYRRLRQFDAFSDYLDAKLDSGHLTTAERVSLGFRIAELCNLEKMSPQALRELIKISPFCYEDDSLALRLVEFAMRIEAYSFVIDIVQRMPNVFSKHPFVEVYLAQSEWARDRLRGEQYLLRLASRKLADQTYWMKLSTACERVLGLEHALRCMQNAVELMPTPVPADVTLRLATLFHHCGRPRSCMRELRKLVGDPAATGHLAGGLVHLSLCCKNQSLAMTFVNDWLLMHPLEKSSAHEQIEACQMFMLVGQVPKIRNCLEVLLRSIEAGSVLTKEQFEQVIHLAEVVDYRIERRVVQRALAQHPYAENFLALASGERDKFGQRLLRSTLGSGQAKEGGLAKFWKIRLPFPRQQGCPSER